MSPLVFWGRLFVYCFLGLHPWYMEVPGLGVELELQLPAYTTATATGELSHVCNLHHSSRQHLILNSLSEAKDQTHILMDTSQIPFHCATMETPQFLLESIYYEKGWKLNHKSFLFPIIS